MRTPRQTPYVTFGVIALILAAGLGSSAALGAPQGGAAPPGSEPQPVAEGHYVNPFAIGNWSVSRTDMGVDYMPKRREPVLAIGDAKILGSSTRSGWPAGGFLWYRLLDGNHAGAVIYVAEHLIGLASAGAGVRAGQQIATALPGYPWTEWGWASAGGEPRAAPCYEEGMETNSGREMARFLASLGARPLRRLRPGPDWPSGRLC